MTFVYRVKDCILNFRKIPHKIRIPFIYGVFSILWVVITDRLTFYLAPNVASATWIGIAKGLLFVFVSILLIYILLEVDERQKASLETALNLVQDSFSTLFARNTQPMWINDPQTLQFITVNEAALQLFGYQREEFLALKLSVLFDPADYSRLQKAIENHGEGLRRTGPWKMITHTGKILDTVAVIVTIDFLGRQANMATIIDLSEQKNIEAALEKTTNERNDFEAFSYSISHDLRASLRAVDGYSQILRDEYSSRLDETGRGFLDKIHLAAQTMNHLIDNLLMLSGITHHPMHLEIVDLGQIARETAEQLQTQDPGRQVSFTLIPEAFTMADIELMRIMLYDLMENAWKYTSKKPAAHIVFDCQDRPDGERVFFVKDDGVGFDPSLTMNMFRPFERFHPATEFSGSGIGLSIVARIIERHHGKIWAEGQVNQGATFYFTLGGAAAAIAENI